LSWQNAEPLGQLGAIERSHLMTHGKARFRQAASPTQEFDDRRSAPALGRRGRDRYHDHGSPSRRLVETVVRYQDYGTPPRLLRSGSWDKIGPINLASLHLAALLVFKMCSMAADSKSASRSRRVPAICAA